MIDPRTLICSKCGLGVEEHQLIPLHLRFGVQNCPTPRTKDETEDEDD